MSHASVMLERKRTQSQTYRSMETSRLAQCSLQVFVLARFGWTTSFHRVARFSKYKPSKPVTPLHHILPKAVVKGNFR